MPAGNTLINFGVPSATDNSRNGMLQPKTKQKFRVLVANFGTNLNLITFTQQVVSVARPNINFNPVTVHSYNSTAYYEGKAEFETVTITLRDDVTNMVSALVGAQLQNQMNFIEQTTPTAGQTYKFKMWVQTMDGGFGVLENWIYEGCFIATVNYQEFDYASADAMTIQMTLRFDNATQDGGLMQDPSPNALYENNVVAYPYIGG